MKEKFIYYLKRFPFYFIGLNLIGIAVALISRAELVGAGGWDAVNINFTHLVPKVSIGQASMIINAVLLLILVAYRRHWKYFLIAITIALIGFIIDFWDLVAFKNIVQDDTWFQIMLFAIGMTILPMGLALSLFSKFPSMIFDQITLMLMDIFKTKNFGVVRIGFEIFSVILAIIFGWAAGLKFTWLGIGAVGIGTIIAAFLLGPMISLYTKGIRKVFPMFVEAGDIGSDSEDESINEDELDFEVVE